jgi:hypothetical protein
MRCVMLSLRCFRGSPISFVSFTMQRLRGGADSREADRHAKKELKKQVRKVRPLERAVEGREDEEAEIVQGYCAAVRKSRLRDDGRAPLEPSGLKLEGRLAAVAESLAPRGRAKGGVCRSRSRR